MPANATAVGSDAAFPSDPSIRHDDTFVLATMTIDQSAAVTMEEPVFDAATQRMTSTLDPDIRWAFARVAGDGVTYGRDRAVASVERVYSIARGATVVGLLLGRWGVAGRAGRVALDLNKADRYYNRITAGRDRTDGVVEGTSQVYPGALLNVEARDPVSHPGETRYEQSAVEIRQVMIDQLRLPTR